MAVKKKSSKVAALIAHASGRRSPQTLTLPPAALEDLKTVLASNDDQGLNTSRVSMLEFRKFLTEEHGISATENTIQRIVREVLGRKTWGHPGAMATPATPNRRAAKKAGR